MTYIMVVHDEDEALLLEVLRWHKGRNESAEEKEEEQHVKE